MKIETSPQPVNTVTDTSSVASTSTGSSSKVMGGPSVSQAASVEKTSEPTTSGIPDLPSPSATNSASTSITDNQIHNIGDLLRWIAQFASELIKMQNDLNVVKQKSVESGFEASIHSAQDNYTKNMTQAVVGIIGSAISGVGAVASFKSLSNVGKTAVGMKGMDAGSAEFNVAKSNIDIATAKSQAWGQSANMTSGGIQGVGGLAAASAERDSKKEEALSQLISKTAENISSTGSANQEAVNKFVNEMLQGLKNLYASASR